jgi:hypothetical protein
MNNVNINDLMTLLAAVDIAVKRGVYSILEIRAVGEVAEKLNAFLTEATEAAKAAEEAAKAADGTAPTEEVAAEEAPTEEVAAPEAPAEQA